ncbi:hypothetical protein HUG17_2716 [Dermatophagoides farinae]|uniref:BZIP domain-containing protein n=1 Tax=Dermatophagoides farinae TaxID=6954 RepID=A0A9D4NUS4_DERFA|nr:hypothetical protein HUG17_2716 [Dermatophagoides farinae]
MEMKMANFELDSYIISSSLHSNHDDFDSYAKYRSSSLISDIDSLSSINDSQSSSSPTLASNTRRLKNRESAARSRQKIKNQLQNLELQQKQLLNKKQAIANEISVAYKEIDRIESSFYDLKINQIGGLITKNKINHNDDHQNYQHHTINMINPFNVVGTKIKTEKDEPLSSMP